MRLDSKKTWMTAWTVVLSIAAAGTLALGQVQPDKLKRKKAQTKEAMDKPHVPGAPGDHHRHLERLVGEWNAEARLYIEPGAEPVGMLGGMKNTMVMDGRFLKSEFVGKMANGTKLAGEGIDGYDNIAGEHVGTWIDSQTTQILTFRGQCEDDGRVVTTYGEYFNREAGKTRKLKSVVTIRSTSMYTFEYYEEDDQGEFRKTAEIIYSKKV